MDRGGAPAQDVVITERGIPVARLSGIASADLLQRLERDGLLTAPVGRSGRVRDGEQGRATSAVSGLVRRLRR